jgi:hypothetical protein
MAGLIPEGERFASLEVLTLIGEDDDSESRYRLRCKCGTDSCVAREDALLSRRVVACFDCAALDRMTEQQRAALAFRRARFLNPELPDFLDYASPLRKGGGHVDSLPTTASPLTIAQALAA